jgi:predicted Fe-Mo cluster-binding NifX family protein
VAERKAVGSATIACVPVTPEGAIDPRWGRAARVAVAEVAHGDVVGWHEHDVGWDRSHDEGAEGAHHARVARFLRDQRVQVVVADHMGEGMNRMLQRMGVRVHLGAGSSAREAVVVAAR